MPLALITEAELLGGKIRSKRQRDKSKNLSSDAVIRNLGELTQGQPVVHLDHGVGRYLGLETIDAGGLPTEFLTLEYAGGDKLFVPVTSLHLISRYTGSDNPPSHKLGGEAWVKARRKAAEKVRDVAAELLDVYAMRAARHGFAFKHDREAYRQFAASFPFEETEDQLNAINAVLSDMCQAKSMDRLVRRRGLWQDRSGDAGGVCGRARRQAGGRAGAHHPARPAALRQLPRPLRQLAGAGGGAEPLPLRQGAERRDEGDGRGQGGHHHRHPQAARRRAHLQGSGAAHRRRGAPLRGAPEGEDQGAARRRGYPHPHRDPIPRTLNMAMSGMRDLSIIATPPAKRLAIKTFVRQHEPAVVREAVLRELKRGGQVYYLHNDVESIEKCAADLAELVPEARIGIAHGQMRERSSSG